MIKTQFKVDLDILRKVETGKGYGIGGTGRRQGTCTVRGKTRHRNRGPSKRQTSKKGTEVLGPTEDLYVLHSRMHSVSPERVGGLDYNLG